MFGATKREKGFKDYCLILQVHPEADGAMVDAAYWHLAKRYNQAASYDPNAKDKLEELNEAYIVLGSPQRRDEYMKVRARVLGEGALPLEPGPATSKPPLAVMARQRPAERAEEPLTPAQAGLSVGHFIASAAVVVALAVALVAIAVSPMLALLTGLVFGAMLAGAAFVLILPSVAKKLFPPRKREAGSSQPSGRSGAGAERRESPSVVQLEWRRPGDELEDEDQAAEVQPAAAPEQPQSLPDDQIEQIKRQTGGYRRVADEMATDDPQQTLTEVGPQRQSGHGLAPLATPEAPPAEPQGLTRDQIDQIKKQAAAYRRAAQESAANDFAPPVAETAELDPAAAEKIRAQTERLKAIAEKFNAAKAKGATPTPDQTEPT
jgi:hypothetical protein